MGEQAAPATRPDGTGQKSGEGGRWAGEGARAMALGLAIGTGVAAMMVPGRMVATTPTVDWTAIKETIATTTAVVRQIQEIQGLYSGMVRLFDSIGNGMDLRGARRALGRADRWVGRAERAQGNMGELRDRFSDEGETSMAPPEAVDPLTGIGLARAGDPPPVMLAMAGGSGGLGIGEVQVGSRPLMLAQADPDAGEEGGLEEGALELGLDDEPGAAGILQRGGEWEEEEWHPEETRGDRPRFADAGQAYDFALRNLFYDHEKADEGSDVQGSAAHRKAMSAVKSRRRALQRSTAVQAWALASAAPMAWEQRMDERHEIIDMLEGASDLRADVQTLGAATILAASGRSDAALLQAIELEQAAIAAISATDPTIPKPIYDEMLGLAEELDEE